MFKTNLLKDLLEVFLNNTNPNLNIINKDNEIIKAVRLS